MAKPMLDDSMVEKIRKMYWDEEMSQAEIAKELGVSREAIKEFMKRHNIPTRSRKEAVRVMYRKKGKEIQSKRVKKLTKFNLSKEELYDLYWNKGYSLAMIAYLTGYSRSTITKWMKKYGIPTRRRLESRKNSVHNHIAREVLSKLPKHWDRVIVLSYGPGDTGYQPDAIVIYKGKIFAYEIERYSSKKLIESRIKKAKEAGFDGIIFYKYYRSQKVKEEIVEFRR